MQHFDGARLSPNSVRNAVWHAWNEPICQYLRTRNPRCSTVYIDNSLVPLARDSLCIFRNDVQILLVRVDLCGWFSLSAVPFSYVVGLVVPPLFCSVISKKMEFSSFSGSVVGCNLEYKRSFLLNCMHSVERRGATVLCFVFITPCPDGSPRPTMTCLPQAWGWPNVGSKHVACVLINKYCWRI